MTMRPQKQYEGFSLIELLVSMAVGAVVLLAAVSMLGSAADSYERVGGGVEIEREARAMISQLSSDLSSGQFHQDSLFDSRPQPWPADRLGILTMAPQSAQSESGRIGDLCAVSYYLADLTINEKTVRCLIRGFRESKETFDALANSSVSKLFVARENIDEPIAFGVVAFQAKPKSRDATGKWSDWTLSAAERPAAVEVRVILARRGLAAKLNEPADWNGAGVNGWMLGEASAADRNKDFEIYETMIRYGNDPIF